MDKENFDKADKYVSDLLTGKRRNIDILELAGILSQLIVDLKKYEGKIDNQKEEISDLIKNNDKLSKQCSEIESKKAELERKMFEVREYIKKIK